MLQVAFIDDLHPAARWVAGAHHSVHWLKLSESVIWHG